MQKKLHPHSLNNSFFVFMWPVIAIIVSLLTILYCLLIMQYHSWFGRLKHIRPSGNIRPVQHFSIIIPARNEAKNIEACIHSIYKNQYPVSLFEVIVLNDFSEDATAEKVLQLCRQYPSLRLINLSDHIASPLNSYKKKAIETGIAQAHYDWIITTDADCAVPQYWLKLFDEYLQTNNAVFVAAPVKYHHTGTLVSLFQNLDFMSLQGIGAASVSAGFHGMCNGANLAYSKKAFYEVNGFKGVDDIASGDDMMLMHKMTARYPNGIGYLFSSDATVSTLPMPTWGSFFNQRIRWASKATNYNDRRIFLVLLLVYIFNCALAAAFIAMFFLPRLIACFVAAVVLKTASELVFMIPVAKFFGQQRLLRWFPFMQPLHIIYTIISGWLGKFGSFQWKGRAVK